MQKNILEKKIGFISLGCDKNRVDLEYMIAHIKKAGFQITANENDANIIIVNTCAFLQSSREESIKELENLKKLKEKKLEKVIMTGCLTRYSASLKEELDPLIDAVLLIKENSKIVDLIYSLYNLKVKICEYEPYSRILTTPSHIAYIKISEGCDNKCSYCAIPNIRGKFVSRPKEDIVKEAKFLANCGVQELIVVAQDVTKYGVDLYGKNQLIELLQEFEKINGFKWIRLHYCYPELITDELIDYIADNNNKVVKYIDVPFQHISNNVLKAMNRKNTQEEAYILVKKLKDKGISIRSTFIVGFPGEDENDFNLLIKFLKESKMDNVGFFAYSREKGTKAYDMPNQIDESLKIKRLNKAQKVQSKIYEEKQKEKIGKTFDVILDEQTDEQKVFVGRTEYNSYDVDSIVYVKLKKKHKLGDIIKVKITDTYKIDLIGEEK